MSRRSRPARAAVGLALAALLAAAACSSPPAPKPDLPAPTEAQMAIRSIQSRTFETGDRDAVVRAVIAALQDLGFIIERANAQLGLVTAARFAEPNFYDLLGLTVTVRPQGESRVLVRMNAIYNNAPVEDPTVYQNFFATLERSLFVGRETQ